MFDKGNGKFRIFLYCFFCQNNIHRQRMDNAVRYALVLSGSVLHESCRSNIENSAFAKADDCSLLSFDVFKNNLHFTFFDIKNVILIFFIDEKNGIGF